jgi:hypothetical protein
MPRIPTALKPNQEITMSNAVSHPPAINRPRRFSDPVSPLNCDIHDSARLLANAVELVDQLELEIISIEADNSRNQRILVVYSRACDALEGAETLRRAGWSHWVSNRFGVEIRWCFPTTEAA